MKRSTKFVRDAERNVKVVKRNGSQSVIFRNSRIIEFKTESFFGTHLEMK